MLGRDQVALLEVYVLAGFVLWHWLDGDGRAARLRASIKPLIAGGIAGAFIVAVPVLLTELLALNSNRPGVQLTSRPGAARCTGRICSRSSFADLFGAMDPKVDFWGAGGFAWNERFGMADLFLAQNMGLLYSGALVAVHARRRRRARRAVVARDPLLHDRGAAHRVLHVSAGTRRCSA